MREILAAKGGTVGENLSGNFFPKFRLPRKFRDLLHAANLRHGTDGFTSPPKEGVLRIFFAPKNPTVSAGFEPANLGTKGQHATPRPPKPLNPRHLSFISFNTNSYRHSNILGSLDFIPIFLTSAYI